MYIARKNPGNASRSLLFAALVATGLYLIISIATPAAAQVSSTSGAGLVGSLAPGHWLKVPNSHMKSVFPDTSLCKCHAVEGPWAVMGAWSGATFDTKRNRLLVWGGGHNDYGGNEVYAFDLNTLTWSRLTEPSSSAGYYTQTSSGVGVTSGSTLGIMPDGNPASRHTYDGLAYIPPPIDKMFAAGGADYPTGGGDNFAWLFDPVSNTWKQASNQNVSLGGYGDIAAYDPATQHVWFVNGPKIKEYNPEADSWTTHSGGANNPTIYRVGAIDPVARELVELDKGHLHVWPLQNGEVRYSSPTSSGDQTIQKAYYPGFVWDPDAEVFVGWDGGVNVYTLDPATWTWTVHPPASDNTVVPTAATKDGIFGRWQYVPSMGVFVGVNETNQDVYLYKPDFGPNVVSGSPGSCNQTTVTSATTASASVSTGFTYAITGSHNPTYYNATGLPTGLSVNTATGVISGTPIVAGTYSVSLVAANNCSQGTAALKLTVTAAAAPSRTPSASFSASRASVSLSIISTQASFAETNNCPGMLQRGDSCTVSVTFSPQDATNRHGSLVIKSGIGDQRVSLTGIGTDQLASAPTLSMSVAQSSIVAGQSTTLSWTSSNVTSCTASGGWSGSKATDGGATVSPTTDTIYTMTCTGSGGSVSRSVSITVPSPTQVTPGATVTSFTLTSAITGSVPFTVGLAFKDGDIPDTPVLSLPDAQVIVKRRWNDGSVKMAIASGETQLTAGIPKTIDVSNGSPASGPALSASDIQAARPTASVSLGSYGTVRLSDLLPSPFGTWVSGPEMVEAHYRATVGSDPGMVVWFYVRLYKSGKVWIRTVVENGYLDTPDGQPAPKQDYTYAPAVTIGATTVFDDSGAQMTQYHNTRWTADGWIGTPDPGVIPRFDTTYLMATKLVPNYMTNAPSDSTLNGLYQTYVPYQHGNLTPHMGNAGYQPSIGLLPNWDALYLTSGGDPRAYRSVLANAEAVNSYPIVWTSSKTALPPLPTDYPYWSVDGNKQGGEGQVGAGALVWEAAHHPSEGYLAYMLTGDYYYLGTMEEQTALCYFMPPYTYGHGVGLHKLFLGQTRGQAWCDRTAGQLAAIGPTADPFVSEFRQVLANEASHWLSLIQQPNTNTIGYIYSYTIANGGYGTGRLSPWQENFWIGTYGYVGELQPLSDMATWNAVRDYMYRAIVGLLGPGGTDGYCYDNASNYTLKVSDTATGDPAQWYDSWRKVFTGTFATTTTACGNTLLGSSGGAPGSASTGYWGNLLPAIAYAVDDGAPGALAAWSRLTHATNWSTVLNSGFGNTPVWGVVPRTTGYTAEATPVPPKGATGSPKLAAARAASDPYAVSTFSTGLASSVSAVVSSLVRKADAAELTLVVSPASIDFGAVAVGLTSPPKMVTITYASPSSSSGHGASSDTGSNPANREFARPLRRLHFNLPFPHSNR